MKKRFLALLVSFVLVVTLSAGCGSETTPANTSSGGTQDGSGSTSDDTVHFKEYTIAVPFPETGLTSFEIMRSNCDLLENATNGKIINAPSDLTPDGVLSFVESQIAAGVEGLIICPPSDSVLPTVTQLCEEAGVYWGIALRSISDPEIKSLVEASPYYVGNCYEDEEQAGYECGKWMGEQGYKKIAVISQAKGDTTCDTREVGLARACTEFGITIVGESRGHVQASDATAATESFLAANPDLDAIFYVGSAASGTHEATVKAIQDAGRGDDVKMVTIDFPDQMEANFESGIQVYAYALSCLTFDPYISLIKVINSIQGTPINEDGSPSSNTMSMFAIDNVKTAREYQTITGNPAYKFFDEEGVKQLLKLFNPDLDEVTLQKMIDEYKPI